MNSHGNPNNHKNGLTQNRSRQKSMKFQEDDYRNLNNPMNNLLNKKKAANEPEQQIVLELTRLKN